MTKTNILIINGFIIGVILIALSLHMKLREAKTDNKPTTRQVEKDFPPEAKAVLSAIRTATADLEKSKQELQAMINDAKSSITAANLSPNVQTTWIAHGVSGQWAVRGNDTKIPVLLGFRTDRIVSWKFSDEP